MTNLRSIPRALDHVKALALSLVATVLIVSSAPAGEIFGSIKADGKTLPKGIKVEIISPAKTYSGETDNYGSYRLYVTEKGKCTLTLHYRQKAPSIQVYSYPKSTRYDFVIEQKDTTYVLKRK